MLALPCSGPEQPSLLLPTQERKWRTPHFPASPQRSKVRIERWGLLVYPAEDLVCITIVFLTPSRPGSEPCLPHISSTG